MKLQKIKEYKETLGIIGVYLFSISLMVSKVGMNLGLGLMILGSFSFLKNFKWNKIEKERKILIVLLLLTLIFSLFSPGKINSFVIALRKTYRYFPLLFIPMYLKKENEILKTIFCICFSIILNFLNGIRIYNEKNWNFRVRYESFGNNLLDDAHMFAMLSFIILSFIIYCILNRKIKFLFLSVSSYFFTLVGLLLTQSRGAWLSLIVGFIFFIFLCIENKKRIVTIILSCFLIGLTFSKVEYLKNNYYVERFKSIKNIEKDSPKIRLIMWEAAINIFKENGILGVGRDNSSKYILQYLENNNKYEEVKNKQSLKEIAKAGNFHNMYFTSISEEGILSLYLFYFWSIILLNELFLLKNLKKKNDKFYYILVGCISLTISFYITGLTENAWRNIWKTNTFLMGVGLYLSIKKIEYTKKDH